MAKLKKDLELEVELLRRKLEELENADRAKINTVINTDIPMNKMIKVVSLYNGVFNLKTSNQSDSSIFKFNFFGFEQPIFYSDLIKCINNQRRFFVDGFCMILDEQVIVAHYLDKEYKKLLTKEEILNFINQDREYIIAKYNLIPIQQKITVLETVAYKMNEGEHIDRNKVDVLSEVSTVDIYELASKLK